MVQGNDWVITVSTRSSRSLRSGFLRLGARSGRPMKELSAYTAWQERHDETLTVQKVSRPRRTFNIVIHDCILLPLTGD
jgi:hypothetical protein